jgi:hypothetical protein
MNTCDKIGMNKIRSAKEKMSGKGIFVAIAMVAMVVLIAGCIDNGSELTQPVPTEELPKPTSIPTPVPTPIPTPVPELNKYVPGDIVTDEQSQKRVGLAILSYNKDTDKYETRVVTDRRTDGNWIYESKIFLEEREHIEELYPVLLAHVELSSIVTLKEKDAEILSKSTHRDSLDWLHIVGEVENTGMTTLKYVKVIATIYDKDGTVIGTDYTYTQPSTLEPRQTAPFEIICTGDVPGSGKYKLTVDY